MGIAAGVFAVLFAGQVWRDPRTFRAGLFLVGAVAFGGTALFADALSGLARVWPDAAGWVVVGIGVAMVGAIVVLGVVLVANGLVMVRRERASLAHVLSLGAGVALLGFLSAWVWALASRSSVLAAALGLGLFPAGYFAVGMVAFLLYGWLYRLFAPTMASRPQAVIVLGAGLAGGRRVTPLLAARLDRAMALAERARARGGEVPWLVASGGRGTDEAVAESQAMAEYLRDHGVDPARILLEDRSHSTEENLALSRRILADHAVSGPVGVVTSSYHVLRAAMILRAAGMKGFAAGSRVAAYYWPSAAIREFAAICAAHLRATLIGLALVCLPVLAVVTYQLIHPR